MDEWNGFVWRPFAVVVVGLCVLVGGAYYGLSFASTLGLVVGAVLAVLVASTRVPPREGVDGEPRR